MEAILLGIYAFFAWLVFGKFKWLPWNIVSQVIVVTGLADRQAEALGAALSGLLPAVLGPDALVVAESDRRAPLELTIPTIDERRYGDTLIRFHGT